MIIDNTLVLSDSQAITATAASTNMIDLGAPGTPFGAPAPVEQDIGKANRIDIAVNVTQGFNNLTSLAIALQVSSDGSTWKEVATHTYSLADISSPTQLNFPAHLPPGTNLRYLQLNYTVSGTAPTTGKIFAGIVAGRQSNNH
jgi:hypothetical protein